MLAEVGPAGQARIAASTAIVKLDGVGAVVCARYLAGSGIGKLRLCDPRLAWTIRAAFPEQWMEVAFSDDLRETSLPPAPPLDFHDPIACEVAQGANEALRVIRSIIDLAP
jgi:hypothetical protein